MINFAVELYSDALIQEMMPLWQDHHKEIQQIRGVKLEPQLLMYQCLATAGILRIYTARNETLALVGYQVFTITDHPHFKGTKQAMMDILYLSPESRLGWMGYQFMRYVDNELKLEGVHLMFRSISARHDFGTVLERLGYELVDLNFMRRVN